MVVLTLLVAAFFFGMGALALAQPARILRTFGVRNLERAGRNEVRAVYGGFGLAMAVLLVVALFVDAIRAGVLVTAAVALLGMALGRLVSAALDGGLDRFPRLFFWIEVALAGVLLVGLAFNR